MENSVETGENPCAVWLFSTFSTDFWQKIEKMPVENSERIIPKMGELSQKKETNADAQREAKRLPYN